MQVKNPKNQDGSDFGSHYATLETNLILMISCKEIAIALPHRER
jgi:hypothetical protein